MSFPRADRFSHISNDGGPAPGAYTPNFRSVYKSTGNIASMPKAPRFSATPGTLQGQFLLPNHLGNSKVKSKSSASLAGARMRTKSTTGRHATTAEAERMKLEEENEGLRKTVAELVKQLNEQVDEKDGVQKRLEIEKEARDLLLDELECLIKSFQDDRSLFKWDLYLAQGLLVNLEIKFEENMEAFKQEIKELERKVQELSTSN